MIPVRLEIAGSTGGHRSTQFSSELTRNVYIDKADANGRVGIHDFPGLKAFGVSSGADRGWHVMADVLYKLNGTTLYRVASNGAYTSLGTVPGSDRAVFADDGSNLLFVAGGVLYKFDGSAVSTISQSVVSGITSVAFINQQFIITGNDATFAVSDVGDPDTWNALNYAQEETSPDSLLRAYVFTQLVYMLGSRTAVPWYNTGIGNPPFDRQDTSLVNIGIAGVHAVCNTDQFMYWFSDDRKFYQVVGASARSISTASVAHIVESLDTVSDCILSSFIFDGQDFVVAAFPSSGRTLCFSEQYQYWFELCAGTNDPGGRWYGNAAIRCYGKNLVADYRNGNVYELDGETYTDAGDTRLRIRVLPPITGDMAGLPGRQLTHSHTRIEMQCGVGLAHGQGSNPVLMCQLSNDGGHTWGQEEHVSMGVMGDYVKAVEFQQFATGYDIRIKIKCSDPVFLSMWGATAYFEDGGY